MGVYRQWFCPELREHIEFENVKLFGFEYPDYAGALVDGLTGRWAGRDVIHLNGGGADQDRYYDMGERVEAEGWKNIWPQVLGDWIAERKRWLECPQREGEARYWPAIPTWLGEKG